MVEKESLREKEPEIAQQTIYDASVKYQKERNQRLAQGRKVIKGNMIPWEQSRQALLRWYRNEFITDTVTDKWTFFVHEIKVHSGKHVHQGGLTIFVLKGRGYTTVDGVRFDWSAGDLICLPIKKGGVEHQHFNLDGKPSRWLAIIDSSLMGYIGRWIEQKSESPDWTKTQKK